MSLYIPKMSDTLGVTIPGLADNFGLLADSRIVEYGSNENGEYWRWENGLQICRSSANTMLEFSADGAGFSTQQLECPYPATFSSVPAISVFPRTGSGNVGSWASLGTKGQSNNMILFRIKNFSNRGTTSENIILWVAIGRWK